MQIKNLRIKSYRSWQVNDTASDEAISRLHKFELYDKLSKEGCISTTALEAIGIEFAYFKNFYNWYNVPLIQFLPSEQALELINAQTNQNST